LANFTSELAAAEWGFRVADYNFLSVSWVRNFSKIRLAFPWPCDSKIRAASSLGLAPTQSWLQSFKVRGLLPDKKADSKSATLTGPSEQTIAELI
jgi:hypothetical protein